MDLYTQDAKKSARSLKRVAPLLTERANYGIEFCAMKRFLVVGLGLILAGCVTRPYQPGSCPGASSGECLIRTELFFGLAKPDGSLISAAEWSSFLDERILPRFPEGLTVHDTTGRYLDAQRHTVKEPSHVVVLFYPPDQASTANEKIAAIVSEYCSQYHQESVLRADSMQSMSLLPASDQGHSR